MKVFFVCAAVLLLSGCSKCSREVPPVDDPAPVVSDENLSDEERTRRAQEAEIQEQGSGDGDSGDAGDASGSGHFEEGSDVEQESLDNRYEERDEQRASEELMRERRKQLGNVPIDNPGPARPNEDRD